MNKVTFDLISIFPEYFSPLQLSLIGKAQEKDLVEIKVHDLRDHANGVHKSVDDTPYGGGAGMVMSPEPWGAAIDQALTGNRAQVHELIILTPAGEKFTQALAGELASAEHLIFACGRYEGIDYRVTEYYQKLPQVLVREISIGDYVVGGGEVATLVIMEAIIRLIPGVLGNPDSLLEESHSLLNPLLGVASKCLRYFFLAIMLAFNPGVRWRRRRAPRSWRGKVVRLASNLWLRGTFALIVLPYLAA
jgi:tRNA (guanine37-N1)-methyltransferase